MNSGLIRWLTFSLAVVSLIGFIIVYTQLLTTPWGKEKQPSARIEFLASALAGLVGGIVAAAFGQRLPEPPATATPQTRFEARLSAFGRFIIPEAISLREVLAAAYVLIYVGMSIWAIVVWAQGDEHTPKLIDNLAVVSLGLIIAIVTAYFKDSG